MLRNFVGLMLILGTLRGENILRILDSSADPGDTNISVEMELINSDVVAAIQFTLHYDTTMLNLTNIDGGSRLSGTNFSVSYNAQGDSVNVVIISFSGDSLLADSGEIAILHFSSTQSVQAGDSVVLSLTNILLSSPQGTHLPVIGENGILRFVSPPRAFVIVTADTVESGQSALVPMILSNPHDAVSGIQFTLVIDSSYVTFDSIIAELPNFTYSTNNFGDSVKIVILSLSGDSILPSSCELGSVVFGVSDSTNPDDSIPIDVRNVVLSNPQASHIPSQGISGYIGVSSSPPDIYFPTGYINTRTFNVIWSDVAGASSYFIQLSNSGDFSTLIDSVTVEDTIRQFSVDQDGNFYVRINSTTPRGYASDWSDIDSFVVDATPPGAVRLLQPPDGAILNTDTISFIWSKVTLKSVKTGKSAPVLYILEVDNNIIDTVINDTDYTLVTGEGDHTWRVRAYDLAGNVSPWSETGHFGVDTSAPMIDSLTTIMDTVMSVGPWAIDAWLEDAYSGIDSAWLIYQIDNNGWVTVVMVDSGNNRWVADIPEIHDSLIHDIMYYVEVIDRAGNSAVSDTISFVAIDIEENNYDGSVNIMIPSVITNQEIEMKYNLPNRRKFTVRIYDISGREIWENRFTLSGSGTKKLNVTMGDGIYFIYIEGAGKEIKEKLIVVAQ